MRMFIQIKNGQPFGHPIFDDNFRQAFPHVDVNNLPPEFAQFTRVERPAIGVYEIYEGVTYEISDSGYADFHHIRQMTQEEKIEKQNATKTFWGNLNGYASWFFDEDQCAFVAPAKHPQDGKKYFWNENTMNWVEADHV